MRTVVAAIRSQPKNVVNSKVNAPPTKPEYKITSNTNYS